MTTVTVNGVKHEVNARTSRLAGRFNVICSRCPVSLSDEALSDQAVVLLAPLYARHEGPSHRPRGRSLSILTAVFWALPGCYGLCFRCALERVR